MADAKAARWREYAQETALAERLRMEVAALCRPLILLDSFTLRSSSCRYIFLSFHIFAEHLRETVNLLCFTGRSCSEQRPPAPRGCQEQKYGVLARD